MGTVMTPAFLLPRLRPDQRPSPTWYWMRTLYVARGEYAKIFLLALGVGLGLYGAAAFFRMSIMEHLANALVLSGLLWWAYSLWGLYRLYGPPAKTYIRRLIDMAGIAGPVKIAHF